jgi:putative transcriptional regulator
MWHDGTVSELARGSLLVATPLLLDPNFWRTVILIIDHDEGGAVGLVLNRPTLERVETHIPAWGGVAAEPGIVHIGGPVEPQIAIGIAIGTAGEPTGVAGLSIIDLETIPSSEISSVRIYAGYAGWSPGQLETEIEQGSWFVVPAAPDDPFEPPEGQWARTLRRQGGHLALLSTFPDDVALN